jgi:hypothetical protein
MWKLIVGTIGINACNTNEEEDIFFLINCTSLRKCKGKVPVVAERCGMIVNWGRGGGSWVYS